MKKTSGKLVALAVIFCAFVSASCSFFNRSGDAAETKEVVFDDGYKTGTDGELIINDSDFDGKPSASDTFGESREEITKVLSDNSKVTTMFDGYGNKIESRYFANHPNVACVVVTTFADGRREAMAYGQNGEHKLLPTEMLDKVLSAEAAEIAQSAGIYDIQTERVPQSVFVEENKPEVSFQPIKMRDSSQYAEPVTVENAPPDDASEAGKPQTNEKDEKKEKPPAEEISEGGKNQIVKQKEKSE